MADYGIGPEDYVEPRCLLCDEPYGMTPEVKAVPQKRIAEKLDAYMAKRDYKGAERHLLYWLEEARLGRDLRGELMVRGELIGHFRKTGNREGALENVDRVLSLLKEMDFEDSISAGTAFVNAATALNAFGENERSLELFEKARKIYEAASSTDPALLGGLYNNMALTNASLGRYGEAMALYEKAAAVMRRVPGGHLEEAVTCLNMADTLEKQGGMEENEKRIFSLLDRAQELLEKQGEAPAGYYAFVLEKCAPAFSYYGYFAAARELSEKAEKIYAGT
ncbi:MAG: tetratricopeptide repeat protein [Lachnospiraceae bacterium]|jgi:tetratricopeptide (TPR) repeat protein|nr:tetratricopeptide repeat protein [Lachnospiraceae bacterium]